MRFACPLPPVAGLLLLLVTACSSGGATPARPTATLAVVSDAPLTVHASEWQFEPRAIVARQGQEVRLVLQNDGRILHNFRVDGLPAGAVQSTSSGPLSASEGEAFVGAESGQQGTLTFVPLQPGSYTFYCTVQGHRQLGMEGTLIVQ